jgi:hypothetical protein
MRRFLAGVGAIVVGLVGCGQEAATADASAGGPVFDKSEALSDAGVPAGDKGEALGGGASAGASACVAALQNHVNWLKGENNCGGEGYGYVHYQIVTHQASGLVSVTSGIFTGVSEGYTFFNPFTQQQVTVPSSLFIEDSDSFPGRQRFSDRNVSARVAGESFNRNFDFSPLLQDIDLVDVVLNDDGRMYFILKSWGNVEVEVQPMSCANGLVYGFGYGVLYSVTLTNECPPG